MFVGGRKASGHHYQEDGCDNLAGFEVWNSVTESLNLSETLNNHSLR